MTVDRTFTTPPSARGNPAENRADLDAGRTFVGFQTQITADDRAWLDTLAVASQRSRNAVLRAVLKVARKYERQVRRALP